MQQAYLCVISPIVRRNVRKSPDGEEYTKTTSFWYIQVFAEETCKSASRAAQRIVPQKCSLARGGGVLTSRASHVRINNFFLGGKKRPEGQLPRPAHARRRPWLCEPM